MQQIHSDDDNDVVNKNPIYYAFKKIDSGKIDFLAQHYYQDKEYINGHGPLVRQPTRPDYKEEVYQLVIKMITLDTNNLHGIGEKSKINE
jgi:hypothetical protein